MHYSRAMPPASSPITGCTCDRLRKLTRRITQHYDARLAPAGLRVTQYSLLAHLVHAGPTTMSALARLMEMDRTTLTRNLRPLADAGLVDVAPGSDARSRVVSATARGREARSSARELWRRAQDEVTRALGTDQVAALHAVLDGSLGRFKVEMGGVAARKRRT
jgi:DNA-binding MarR family transcriptional regulator